MPLIRSPFEKPELRKELRSGIKLLPQPIQAAVTKAALKDPKNLAKPKQPTIELDRIDEVGATSLEYQSNNPTSQLDSTFVQPDTLVQSENTILDKNPPPPNPEKNLPLNPSRPHFGPIVPPFFEPNSTPLNFQTQQFPGDTQPLGGNTTIDQFNDVSTQEIDDLINQNQAETDRISDSIRKTLQTPKTTSKEFQTLLGDDSPPPTLRATRREAELLAEQLNQINRGRSFLEQPQPSPTMETNQIPHRRTLNFSPPENNGNVFIETPADQQNPSANIQSAQNYRQVANNQQYANQFQTQGTNPFLNPFYPNQFNAMSNFNPFNQMPPMFNPYMHQMMPFFQMPNYAMYPQYFQPPSNAPSGACGQNGQNGQNMNHQQNLPAQHQCCSNAMQSRAVQPKAQAQAANNTNPFFNNFENGVNQSNQTQDAQCRKSFMKYLDNIPLFSGDSREDLMNFIEICDTIDAFCSNEYEYAEFITKISFQLRGEARSVLSTDTDWMNIKERLKSKFKYLSNRTVLDSQIENLRQEKDESLVKYADRARKLLNEKNKSFYSLSEEQKEEHDRIARKSFARGISNQKLRDVMITQGAHSLEEIIGRSLDVDNEVNNSIARREMICTFCKNIGHREVECRSKENGNSPMGQLASALSRLISNTGNTPNNNFRGNNNNNFGGNNQGRNNDNNGYGQNRQNSNRNSAGNQGSYNNNNGANRFNGNGNNNNGANRSNNNGNNNNRGQNQGSANNNSNGYNNSGNQRGNFNNNSNNQNNNNARNVRTVMHEGGEIPQNYASFFPEQNSEN